ncbi:MAG: hypothetical protein JF597_32805 [Streptomyces sp.]|nr:hypothetical protein [Streptomyces sp.]
MTLSAAMVANKRQDILAVNPLARALYSPVFESITTRDRGHANLARYHFLDSGARDFHGDWNVSADILAALLRTEADRNPHDQVTWDLVGELTVLSPEFRIDGSRTTSSSASVTPRYSVGTPIPAASSWPTTRWSCGLRPDRGGRVRLHCRARLRRGT